MSKKRYKDTFKGSIFLLNLCWKYSKLSILYLTLECVINSLIPFVSIIFPKFIIDELMGKQRIEYLALYTGILIGTSLIGSTLSRFFHVKYFLEKLNVSNHFFIDMDKNLIEADIEQIESSSFLDLKEKADKFLYADGYGFGGVLDKAANIVSQSVVLLGIISIISTLNPVIILIFILLIVLNTYFSSKVKKENIKLSLERSGHERRLRYDMSLCEQYKYAKEVRINNLCDWLLDRLKSRVGILKTFYKKSNYNNLKAQAFSNIMTFIQQIVTYFYLIHNVINKVFSIGSFTMYLNAVNNFANSMYAVMDSIVDIRRFNDYYDAVEEYLNLNRKQREGKNIKLNSKEIETIEFKNVSFKYPNQTTYTLKNINIKITKNEKLSIVGENGAGKTTFVKLLLKLYSPTEGQILLNGNDIKDYDFDDYMELFSAVFQDYSLFCMSLKENVALKEASKIDDEEVKKALIKSGFENKLNTLNKSIDTQIYRELDQTGFEPSGGEGQKIALARAIYKKAPAVILDEPAAALDPRAEYEMYQNFNELVKDKLTIYISHRLSSSKFCDNIAVFKNGEIVEYGSHDKLINKNGYYAELFNMQAQFYIDKENEILR